MEERILHRITIRFRETIESAFEELSALSHRPTSDKPRPGSWAPVEVLGHLVDSACNNHRRLVLGLMGGKFQFEGYAQDNWVSVQNYVHADWSYLLQLWRAYNLHLCHILEHQKEDVLKKHIDIHNFNNFGFGRLDEKEVLTVEVFIDDYIDHIEHHLKQILVLF